MSSWRLASRCCSDGGEPFTRPGPATAALLRTAVRGRSLRTFGGQRPRSPRRGKTMLNPEHSACPVHADFDPLSPAFLADPFAVLDSLPRDTPVFYAPAIDYYVVTRYDDIEAVFLDHETYSAAPAQLPPCHPFPEAPRTLPPADHNPQPPMASLARPPPPRRR